MCKYVCTQPSCFKNNITNADKCLEAVSVSPNEEVSTTQTISGKEIPVSLVLLHHAPDSTAKLYPHLSPPCGSSWALESLSADFPVTSSFFPFDLLDFFPSLIFSLPLLSLVTSLGLAHVLSPACQEHLESHPVLLGFATLSDFMRPWYKVSMYLFNHPSHWWSWLTVPGTGWPWRHTTCVCQANRMSLLITP